MAVYSWETHQKKGGIVQQTISYSPKTIHRTVRFRGLVATFPQSTCEFSGTSEVLVG